MIHARKLRSTIVLLAIYIYSASFVFRVYTPVAKVEDACSFGIAVL